MKFKLKKIFAIGLSLLVLLTMSLSVYATDESNYSRMFSDDGAIRTMGSIQANYTSDGNYYSTVMGTNRYDQVASTNGIVPSGMDLTVKMTGIGSDIELSRKERANDWPIATGYMTNELIFDLGDDVWYIYGEYTSYFADWGTYLNPPDTNLSLGG